MTSRTRALGAIAALALPALLLTHAGTAAAAPPRENSKAERTTRSASVSFIEGDSTDALGLPGDFYEGGFFITEDAQGTRLNGGMNVDSLVPNTDPDDETPDGQLLPHYLGYVSFSSTQVRFSIDVKSATATATADVLVTDEAGRSSTWPLALRLHSPEGMQEFLRDQSWSDGQITYRSWERLLTSSNTVPEGSLGGIDFAVDADDLINPYRDAQYVYGSFETVTIYRTRPPR
ncbi:hypothetical protein GCM10027586_19200 [Kineococcus gypseus]|uniref:hypothetical protein n=1 Tax=Kineococcus gypseus TaxID=1637102 RepID=UPI003D7C6C8C